jgi:hypothetical protein
MPIELQVQTKSKPTPEYLEEQRLLRTLQVPWQVDGKLLREIRERGLKTSQEMFARHLGMDLGSLRVIENGGRPLSRCRRKTLLNIALMLELLGVRFTKNGWELVENSPATALAVPSKPGGRAICEVGYRIGLKRGSVEGSMPC